MNVTIIPMNDLLVECTESYVLSIEVSSGPTIIGEINTVSATVNIEDDDSKCFKRSATL